MQLFKYREDRPYVAAFILYFCIDILVYLYAENVWFLIFWLLLGIYPKGCICSFNHHHQHVPTFKYVVLNRMLEFMYGLQTGATTHAWTLHHVLGHHLNYLDQSKDESAWRRKDGKTMGELEYTFNVGITAYTRAFKVGLKHRKYLPAYLGMMSLTAIAVAALIYYRPLNAIFVYVLPMIISLFGTVYATYVHHTGLDSRDHFSASNNILNKWYNVFTGNLGYHTAHHYRQAVHWSRLPQLHAEIAGKIPPERFLSPGVPYSWFGQK